jgi:hypothetical protein
MTRPQKYNFKVKYNQFGHDCTSSEGLIFEDTTEKLLIDHFEVEVLKLKPQSSGLRTMIELGSNNCFYSMLFRQIMQPQPVLNIMIEPYTKFRELGIEHFKLNNFHGKFLDRRIYSPEKWCNMEFNCEPIKIDDIFQIYNINKLDVLHCDIDGAEVLALKTAEQALQQQKIKLIFISTHSSNLHNQCKEILTGYNYSCILDHPQTDIGYDSVVIFAAQP